MVRQVLAHECHEYLVENTATGQEIMWRVVRDRGVITHTKRWGRGGCSGNEEEGKELQRYRRVRERRGRKEMVFQEVGIKKVGGRLVGL